MRDTPHLLLVALLAVSCGSREAKEQVVLKRKIVTVPRYERGGDVMARVNGVPILREDLVLQMRDGQGRRSALKELIRREALAQEAIRLGLDRDPLVRRAQRRAMAHLLIERELANNFTKKEVPREMVERAYQLNKKRYVHPELVTVLHHVVLAYRRHDADHHRRAKLLARKIRTAATARRLSIEEFLELAKTVGRLDPELEINTDRVTTPQRGYTVDSFADAAFALSGKGAVSPVVQSIFGYHVIYLVKRIPAINIPLSQAEDEIRERVFDQARKQAFEVWIKRLEKRYEVSIRHGVTLPDLLADEGTE
jgi:hypothetical protein